MGLAGNGINQQFTYDGAGNRTSKTVDGQTTEYLNDINQSYTQVLQTYSEDGALQDTYTYGVSRIMSQGETDEVYLYDGRGSVSGVLTDTKKLISYAYTAYGDLLPESPTPRVYGYNAEATDSQTGLQYLRARYYSPETGRFIQKDEYKGDFAKPETLNRYAYCSGNPVLYSDPSGHKVTQQELDGLYEEREDLKAQIEDLKAKVKYYAQQYLDMTTKLNTVYANMSNGKTCTTQGNAETDNSDLINRYSTAQYIYLSMMKKYQRQQAEAEAQLEALEEEIALKEASLGTGQNSTLTEEPKTSNNNSGDENEDVAYKIVKNAVEALNNGMAKETIIDKYNAFTDRNYDYSNPHCAMFASVIATMSGNTVNYSSDSYDIQNIPIAPSTKKFAEDYYSPANRLGDPGEGYTPKAGDFILFYQDQGGYFHTGIVEEYYPTTGIVYTIEANGTKGDKPARYSYNLSELYDNNGKEANFGINGGTEYSYNTR